jgi:cell division protein FtsI (penicillin-binding protein 3)
VDTAAISFGQGISVTPLQLICAMSAIANDGLLMKPSVVRAITDKNNNPVEIYQPEALRQVISPATARRVTSMLTQVVEAKDGTGKNAHIVDVSVAGKTGTAQKFDFTRGAYSSENVRTSFIGFFPAADPQVVILVILDEPQHDKWGGVAAAPVFRDISEQILNRFKTGIREVPAVQPAAVRLQMAAAERMLTGEDSSDEEDDPSLMPDFRGMTIRETLKLARSKSIEPEISGSGWAVRQYPAPGSVIGKKRICKITFEIKN